ncbi:hypothetical protein H5410_026301, partial [Solanum commersonii]
KEILQATVGGYKLRGTNQWRISQVLSIALRSSTQATTDHRARECNITFLASQSWKVMFVLTVTIDEFLQRIKNAKTPKEAWDTLATIFTKKNDARLQRLEN